MKSFRIFEDSATFSMVIKQNVQENTSSEKISLFPRDPDSTLLVWAWEVSYHTCRGNGTKRPKASPSETTPYRDGLSTIITFMNRETRGKVVAEA